MSRSNKLRSIAAQMHRGAWKALMLAGVSEGAITKWSHHFKEDLEADVILIFIKDLNAEARKLLTVWEEKSEEHWRLLECMDPNFNELKTLRKLKNEFKKFWQQRPRNGVRRYL